MGRRGLIMFYNLDQAKQTANQYYYVFVGQNATTGQPNPITGRLSYYGNIIAFRDKAIAKAYVNNFYSNNSSEFAKAGTAKTLRKYKQGQTMFNYYSDLCMLDCQDNEYKHLLGV